MQIDDKLYEIEMSPQHGHHIHSLTAEDFIPNGAVAVVTSMQCLEWLRDVVDHLWLFKVGGEAPYRGMPLIILALDRGECSLVARDVRAESAILWHWFHSSHFLTLSVHTSQIGLLQLLAPSHPQVLSTRVPRLWRLSCSVCA